MYEVFLLLNAFFFLYRYLVEKYDPEQRLMGGQDEGIRNRVRMFIHAAEGTFMVHCLAITYARVSPPSSFHLPIPRAPLSPYPIPSHRIASHSNPNPSIPPPQLT